MASRLSVHRIYEDDDYRQGYKNSSILEKDTERIAYLFQRIAWHHEEIEDMQKELHRLNPDFMDGCDI